MLNKKNTRFLFFLLMAASFTHMQAQDSTRKDLICSIGFYTVNNAAVYLTVHAKTKTDGRFQPVKGIAFRLYLDKDSADCLTGNIITDAKGESSTLLSTALQSKWREMPAHTFIAISEATKAFNPSRTELPVTKAHLLIDTADGKNIVASMLELKSGQWIPVKGVDIKVAVKRLQSNLPVSDKEFYTTDSTGKITAEYKRDGLPGDAKGMITLIAKVEDNDLYGNLQAEKTVPWGSIINPDNSFNKRTLFATRLKTPVWLLFMAYSIIISVWSVIIYLVFQIIKMKHQGKLYTATNLSQ